MKIQTDADELRELIEIAWENTTERLSDHLAKYGDNYKKDEAEGLKKDCWFIGQIRDKYLKQEGQSTGEADEEPESIDDKLNRILDEIAKIREEVTLRNRAAAKLY